MPLPEKQTKERVNPAGAKHQIKDNIKHKKQKVKKGNHHEPENCRTHPGRGNNRSDRGMRRRRGNPDGMRGNRNGDRQSRRRKEPRAGRLRHVWRDRDGIPADQKVPNTGNFKSTKTKSLFGTEEHIIEYDWTAGSDADNKAAEERLQKLKEEAEKTEKEKAEESSASAESDQSETPAAGNAEKEAGMGAKQ